jgi:hypothetical protein
MLGLYECREDTDEDMLLVRMGLPSAADDLARTVYDKVRPSVSDPVEAAMEEALRCRRTLRSTR